MMLRNEADTCTELKALRRRRDQRQRQEGIEKWLAGVEPGGAFGVILPDADRDVRMLGNKETLEPRRLDALPQLRQVHRLGRGPNLKTEPHSCHSSKAVRRQASG